MREKKAYPVYEQVEILDAGAEGNAMGRIGEVVVFIDHAVPGDVADIEVYKKKKSYMEGRVLRTVKESPLRSRPFCEHFGVCGGCKWQDMQYAAQLSFKQKQVEDALRRLAKVPFPPVLPILPSAETQYYRNKLEYTFSSKRWLTLSDMERADTFSPQELNALGFHIPGRFDKILDIHNCYLQPEPSNSIRLAVKQYAQEHGLDFFDIRSQEGFLRNLIIRTSTTGDLMVIVVFHHEDREQREGLLDFLHQRFPAISSLLYVINPKKNDTISDLDVQLHYGQEYITERMENLVFRIGPRSFYQTNSLQAYELYKVTREFAGIGSGDLVYDLYTGTGTIANFVASGARKVVGIEYVEAAIEDAKENSRLNGISNTRFFAGDIKNLLSDELLAAEGRPDVIITDPPRAGMHEDVTRKLLEVESSRIVYVSCNPSTQARDLAILDEKYHIGKIQPVDMFPHTHHVENIVLLLKKQAL
jgi:23S rRNA (uracil1939-C5)-methyltransferase